MIAIPALEISGISKHFSGHPVLKALTFCVNEGEIYGFVGANGAGKSTAMRIIIGILSPDQGQVCFDKKPIDINTRRKIGYMPEERGLYGKESISEQLIFLGKLHGLSGARAVNNTHTLLERLNLSSKQHEKLDALSLGNQQKVQLAAALVHEPTMLVLDEPFSGLDPLAVRTMTEILTECASNGIPVLFSSHQLDVVQRICHRIGILSDGAMVAEGCPSELRSSGPLTYRVETTARDWYPAHTVLVDEDDQGVTLQLNHVKQIQTVLRAAQHAGPVTGFFNVLPSLNDLFRKYVS